MLIKIVGIPGILEYQEYQEYWNTEYQEYLEYHYLEYLEYQPCWITRNSNGSQDPRDSRIPKIVLTVESWESQSLVAISDNIVSILSTGSTPHKSTELIYSNDYLNLVKGVN